MISIYLRILGKVKKTYLAWGLENVTRIPKISSIYFAQEMTTYMHYIHPQKLCKLDEGITLIFVSENKSAITFLEGCTTRIIHISNIKCCEKLGLVRPLIHEYTPYLTLTGELLGIFRESFWRRVTARYREYKNNLVMIVERVVHRRIYTMFSHKCCFVNKWVPWIFL